VRFLTAGESHGQALLAIVEGLPAGLSLDAEVINRALARRQQGYGRGERMAIEADQVEILSGVRHGVSLGSPLALLIRNRDWDNWRDRMSVAAPASPAQPDTTPRPGHADLAGVLKYGFGDVRNVLERASARETAARVAVGAVAACLLAEIGVRVVGFVTAIGGVAARPVWESLTLDEIRRRAAESPVGCPDPEAEAAMRAAIDSAKSEGDTLGGIIEVLADGVPPGLGSYVHWDRRLDGRLAQALISIPAIKGVEIGPAFANAAARGSVVHDEIKPGDPAQGLRRPTNRAGGLEGGVTNGQMLVLRAAMKPISTLGRPLASVDLSTGAESAALRERADVCAVPAAAVVAEAVVAWVLAAAALEKFGGDCVADFRAAHAAYLERLRGIVGGA